VYLEDSWSKVVQAIRSSQLVEEEKHHSYICQPLSDIGTKLCREHTQEEPLEVIAVREHVLHDLQITVASMDFLLSIDLVDSLLVLKLDVGMFRRQVAKFAEIAQPLLSFANTHEITGCLQQKGYHDAHACGGNDLDHHSRLPLTRIIRNVGPVPQGHPVVDPEGEHQSDDNAQVVCAHLEQFQYIKEAARRSIRIRTMDPRTFLGAFSDRN
jgi:hypothetical protein